MHIPVLLKEVLDGLKLENGKFIIDGTVNGGGHAREIIKRIMPDGFFLGTDWDKEVLESTQKIFNKDLAEYEDKVKLIWSNYSDLLAVLEKEKLPKADGILLDLGFSSFHVDESGRGFSFLRNEELDMRYDPSSGASAGELINSLEENKLADIFWKYGDERMSRRFAKAIVDARRKNKISTAKELAEIISSASPSFYRNRRISPATKVFQAIRIYVNNELGNLEKFLLESREIINSGGRLAIISFHSLEDRIIKNKFKEFEKEKVGRIINKKVIKPTREEAIKNPRSRSAKLRIFEF